MTAQANRSESIQDSRGFVDAVAVRLANQALHRQVVRVDDLSCLKKQEFAVTDWPNVR